MAISGAKEAGIEAIVFDAVGTLIDPSPSVASVYREAARRQGVELDEAVVKSRFHQEFRNDEIDEARGPLATDEPNERRRWRRIVADVLPEVPEPDRAFEELWEHFARPDAWRCFPDVAPTVARLREQGLAVAIGSNFDGRLRSVVAGLKPLSSFRDSVVISSEVGYRKPHPSFYQAVCACIGLLPQQILCVGDDFEHDVRGPERAGLRGLLIDRRGTAQDEAPAISSLAMLESILGGGLS